MNQSSETQTLSDFQRDAVLYVEQLKKSHQPLVLTVEGRAELVVLDAASYQEIMAKAEFAETVQAIQEGIESFKRGEGRPAREALSALR